jgi:hypothetical protein
MIERAAPIIETPVVRNNCGRYQVEVWPVIVLGSCPTATAPCHGGVDVVKVYPFWLASAGAATALRAKTMPAMDTIRLVTAFIFLPPFLFFFMTLLACCANNATAHIPHMK